MKFEVPQFIDVEDRIFGPFTWKQFVYLAGGAGAAFILFVFLPFILFVLIGGPVIALALGLAFYQINNRPLSFMIEAMVTYFTRGRQYRWKKDVVKSTATPMPAPDFQVVSHNNLSSLSRSLELRAMNKDIEAKSR
ncbi:MAG: hypothetical protein RLZZ234_62 [Candidatus Parcubacteria bacterium]|jgi:hypothetical protein